MRTPTRSAPLLAPALLAALAACAQGQNVEQLRASQAPPNSIWVESLGLASISQDYGSAHAGRTVDRNPLKLKGVTYPHGIGTHAGSEMEIDLKGAANRFSAMVGLDDERTGQGSITFEVWVDGKKKAETPVMHGGDEPRLLTVDLTGSRKLTLVVGDGGDGITNDHGDWAGALLTLAPGAAEKPVAISPASEPAPPVAADESPMPAIHGPTTTGSTPGRPFLFLVPATGEGPLTFSARDLPDGLTLDPKTGIITGSLKREGATTVQLTVTSPRGTSRSELRIVGGARKLALTPPMGWNSWNVWGTSVTAEKVRAAADALVASGLAAHGFQYINIDDAWEAGRDANGNILTNEKFGDIRALAAYVHSKGLKLGIYSSPGPKTCGGYTASYDHEQQDANTWASWGIDYLKYDWCSYSDIARDPNLAELKKPYSVMREALDRTDRDIVYSLCQYGMGNVWEWGADVGGNLWRTTGDITDTWSSMAGIGFTQNGHEKYAGPGHWNDPDMLVVGRLGWGPNIHPTRLGPNEQITHISLWSLLAAPLLIGCDLTQIDPFTKALLTNDEVLAIDQDPLGKAGGRKAQSGSAEVWARPLADGTIAVGLFNRGREKADVTARWSDLGLEGRQAVRDLWLHRDLGAQEGSFTTSVPAHGAMLVKIGTPRRP